MSWKKKRKIRVSGTNRHVYRPRPESEWVKVEAPHLRIITRELWEAVRQRFKVICELWGREKGRPGFGEWAAATGVSLFRTLALR
jgi:hypothetical protein